MDITDRKREETSVKVSEVRYRRLFESANDGILILDAHAATITDANPFMAELLGYSEDEFVGKELWQIGLFKDVEASKAAMRELQEQRYIRYEDLPLETKAGRGGGSTWSSSATCTAKTGKPSSSATFETSRNGGKLRSRWRKPSSTFESRPTILPT